MTITFPPPMRKNDDVFLCAAKNPLPFVKVYEQREVEVVHGPSCRNVESEIFVDRCNADGALITARRGGGGTVVLSPGVLVTVAVGEKKEPRESALEIFNRLHDVIIEVLKKNGVTNARRAGISDIAVDGKKILGSSLYLGSTPPYFYYQSSLMVANDVLLMNRYLRHPPREPDYRAGREHGDFCTNLKELGVTVGIQELSAQIESALIKNLTPLRAVCRAI